jgi:hypothetical protein
LHLGKEVIRQSTRRLHAHRLGDEALPVLTEQARVDPVGAGLDGVTEMVCELGGAERLFGSFGGERRQRLSLRVDPALERDGGQLGTLL